jgi:hypothetical protein
MEAEKSGRDGRCEDQSQVQNDDKSEANEHKEKLKTTFNGSRKKFFAAGGSQKVSDLNALDRVSGVSQHDGGLCGDVDLKGDGKRRSLRLIKRSINHRSCTHAFEQQFMHFSSFSLSPPTPRHIPKKLSQQNRLVCGCMALSLRQFVSGGGEAEALIVEIVR